MLVTIGYGEINTLILQKTNQPIKLSYESNNKFRVTYTYKVNVLWKTIEKNFSIPFSISHASLQNIVLQNESDCALSNLFDVLVSTLNRAILSLLGRKSIFESTPVRYDLGKLHIGIGHFIDTKALESHITINGVYVCDLGFKADITLHI